MNGVLKSLEEALADVQRVDAKAQSALDLKKQNVKDETKKRKELVKSMEEVTGQNILPICVCMTCVISCQNKTHSEGNLDN